MVQLRTKHLLQCVTLFAVVGTAYCARAMGVNNCIESVHNCVTCAGYTWCDASEKCVRVWEEGCADLTPDEMDYIEELVEA